MNLITNVKDAIKKGREVVLRMPEVEVLVRDATNNEQWGPSGTQMRQIAAATHHYTDYDIIMNVLWKRLADRGKNWRHVYKSLLLLDYLIKNGSDRVINESRRRIIELKTLTQFQYIDEHDRDTGLNVRERAKTLVDLLHDDKRIRSERKAASKNRGKWIGMGSHDRATHAYNRGSGAGRSYGGGYDDGYRGSTGAPYRSRPSYREEEEEEEEEEEVEESVEEEENVHQEEENGKESAAKETDLVGFGGGEEKFDPFSGSGSGFDPRVGSSKPTSVTAPPADEWKAFEGSSGTTQSKPTTSSSGDMNFANWSGVTSPQPTSSVTLDPLSTPPSSQPTNNTPNFFDDPLPLEATSLSPDVISSPSQPKKNQQEAPKLAEDDLWNHKGLIDLDALSLKEKKEEAEKKKIVFNKTKPARRTYNPSQTPTTGVPNYNQYQQSGVYSAPPPQQQQFPASFYAGTSPTNTQMGSFQSAPTSTPTPSNNNLLF